MSTAQLKLNKLNESTFTYFPPSNNCAELILLVSMGGGGERRDKRRVKHAQTEDTFKDSGICYAFYNLSKNLIAY